MTFQDFKQELFAQAKAKGFTDYEVLFLGSKGFSVRVFKGEISEYKNTSNQGVGFRGTYNGKMGYSASEKMDETVIGPMLENAAANAGIIEEEEVEKLYPGDESYPEVNTFNPALDEVSAAEKIKWALEMEAYAMGLDPRVKMVDHCMVGTQENEMAMANSYGLDLSQKRNIASAVLLPRVEENGVMKSAHEYWAGRDFAEFDYKALAKKAVDEALSALGAASIETGAYPIAFDNNTAKDLFAVFAGVFMAENAQKGFSLLSKDKLDTQIAAHHITLRDDGICGLSLGSMAFDAEGVATKQKAIIENGVLKTLLYNLKSAAKDGAASTGNASKAGLGGAISTSCTNYYLVPSETSFDEMIAGVDKGVLITKMAGLHSGVNAVSGDFSVSAEGFLIEAGKVTTPVEMITIAGNFYDVLKNIAAVGNDLRFHSTGHGGMGMPSILVDGIKVSGL
ncbi:MAG: TldD/PmbA family protein [Defluviitaleaceae bacterium]|nr:TldD/PmbA family protein [Defluviitaleaceae bacterium]